MSQLYADSLENVCTTRASGVVYKRVYSTFIRVTEDVIRSFSLIGYTASHTICECKPSPNMQREYV